MAKVKLLIDIPVNIEHGMTAGRICEVLRKEERAGRGANGVWVQGDAGEEVKLLTGEFEYVKEAENGTN